MTEPPRSLGMVRGLGAHLRLQPLRALYNLGLRHVAARRIRQELRTSPPALGQALDAIVGRWGAALGGSKADTPIFVLGAGWRCGSTWLQRLIMSSGQALVWGEPFDRSGLVQTTSSQLLPLGENWPPDKWFVSSREPSTLTEDWVANLYPSVAELIEAHRALFRRVLEEPARERGAARWGLKEIRLTTAHARYLRLLFPGAKFLFLIRNPFDAYRSYREAWNPWFERWPDGLTVTAGQFGEMWTRLAGDFVESHATAGGLLLRYEDLVSNPATTGRVSEYLGLPLTPELAAASVRGNPHPRQALPKLERWLLLKQVRGLSQKLGYL
jgi:hypothetical protein